MHCKTHITRCMYGKLYVCPVLKKKNIVKFFNEKFATSAKQTLTRNMHYHISLCYFLCQNTC
jgi:hypothetical protein